MALLEGVAAGAGGCCSEKGSKAMKRDKRLPKEKLEEWIDDFVGFRGDEAIRIRRMLKIPLKKVNEVRERDIKRIYDK